jgi:hypothetical protein
MPIKSGLSPTLGKDQEDDLGHHKTHHNHPQVRDRCAAILLLAEGHDPEEVAFELLSQPITLEVLAKWVGVFNERGVPGLLSL